MYSYIKINYEVLYNNILQQFRTDKKIWYAEILSMII